MFLLFSFALLIGVINLAGIRENRSAITRSTSALNERVTKLQNAFRRNMIRGGMTKEDIEFGQVFAGCLILRLK